MEETVTGEDSEKYRPRGFKEVLERASGSSQQFDRSGFDALGDQFVADMTEYFDPDADNTRPGSPFADPDETWVFNTLRLLVVGGYNFNSVSFITVIRLIGKYPLNEVRLNTICEIIKRRWPGNPDRIVKAVQDRYDRSHVGSVYDRRLDAVLRRLEQVNR